MHKILFEFDFFFFRVRDSSGNPFLRFFLPQKRLFHNMIFLLEFNERCLKQITRPWGTPQKTKYGLFYLKCSCYRKVDLSIGFIIILLNFENKLNIYIFVKYIAIK
ncbi:hypothetical protein B0A58_10250 [Flavobacterium branchiophilum NBRC 15030 = ATCC 35035]|nr:hypothetical protein B0A58_10250 [Flavobacterium branchiophilum NBRC 15030 = ATCC 35035]